MRGHYALIPTDVFELGHYHLSVYTALVIRLPAMGKDNLTPSHAAIAADTGLSVRKVKSVLKELRIAGWIDWDTRHDDEGGRLSNLYTVHATQQRSSDAVVAQLVQP